MQDRPLLADAADTADRLVLPETPDCRLWPDAPERWLLNEATDFDL